MKRVSIIGCPGSGKSYFARRLYGQIGLPLVHLDKEYHSLVFGDDKDENRAVWARRLSEILNKPLWITDGNYFSTQDVRLAASDTILIFDFPKRIIYRRIIKRWLQYRKAQRPDMPDDWRERLSLKFIRSHVIGFDKKYQKVTANLLSSLDGSVEIIIFRHPRDAARYLSSVGHC
jgi:adenylate kinase family enzyme